MAPASKKRRRTQYRPPKKIKESAKELPSISMAASPTLSHLEGQNSNDISGNGCSTPKSPRYQIPEPLTCPPAPKKRRVALHCSPPKPNISFFNPPDLEAFFYFALRNVSV